VVNVREKASHEAEGQTEGDKAEAEGAPAASEDGGVKGRSGFALVLADRYLLLIAVLMLLSNLVNTTGEYILGKTVVAHVTANAGAAGGIDEKKIIGEFYGNYFTWVNIVSALLQAFVVSRLLKHLGVRTAIMVLPFVALFGYLSMAFIPFIGFIRGAKIAENSLDYSVQNTTRNALYLPTSREAKYKAKQANDTFFVRLGDLFSAGLVFAGTTWLAFGPRQFALTAVALVVVWLIVAFTVGRRFQKLAHTA
jgi:ATP:ADP antiporter, AAA family